MKIYWHTDSNQVKLEIQADMMGARYGGVPIQLQFLVNNTPYLLATNSVVKTVLKKGGAYNQDQALALISSFTAPGSSTGFYTATLDLNTVPINEAFVQASEPADYGCMLCIAYQVGGAGLYIPSPEIGFDLNNAILTGYEAAPTELPTTDAWLTARAVRYDIVQTLDAGEKVQAQQNMGTEIGVNVQAWNAGLDALAAFNTNGILVQTAIDTFVGRTLVAGSTKISIGNGSGVAGNPSVDVTEANLSLQNIGGTLGASQLANTAVVAGAYTSANITIDAQGRITSAANGAGGGTVTAISIATANGLSGSSSGGATPVLTLDISGLDATKIGAGGVTSTEFGYIGGLTSDAQAQINTKIGGTIGATDNSLLRSDGIGGVTAQGTGANATLTDIGQLTLAAYVSAPQLRAESGVNIITIDGDTSLINIFRGANNATFDLDTITTNPVWTMPDATGTVTLGTGSANTLAYWSGTNTTASATTGTGVITALGVNVGSAGAFVTFNGAGGTPSSVVLTNATGTATGLTAGNATAAVTATNLAGGLGAQIPYQSAAGTTAMLANGTAGQVLTSSGTTVAPTWTTISSGLTVGTTAVTSGTDGRVFFQAGGVLSQDADLTFVTDTLTATKLASTNLAITGGTVTVSTPVISTSQTWNDGAVAFTAKTNNVTSTANAAGSILEEWKDDNVMMFRINQDGSPLMAGGNGVNIWNTTATGTNGSRAFHFGGYVEVDDGNGNPLFTTTNGGGGVGEFNIGERLSLASSGNAARAIGDVPLFAKAAATLQMGLDAAGVTNQMFTAANRITSDGVGASLTLAGGNGRGGAGGSLLFSTYTTAGAATIGTLTTRMTLDTSGVLTLADAVNIATNATTGTQFGTATTQKIGFYGTTPTVQGAVVAAPTGDAGSGADTVNLTNLNTTLTDLQTAVNALRTRLSDVGIIAS